MEKRCFQCVSIERLVLSLSAKLIVHGVAQYDTILPDAVTQISPEFGETHATGMSISPVP